MLRRAMLKVGDTIDRYTIEGLLGDGGMGQVYRAHDARLGRRVALKLVKPSKADDAPDAEATARLVREARAAAQLDHPNAVALFDVGEADGAAFIAMELVAGKTLRAFVGDAGVSWREKLRWLVDVARALDAAHKAGVVHRDVKPENVMVRDDGVIKVLDFGIARRAQIPIDPGAPTESQHLGTLTARGVTIGTPLYMSPEQLRTDALDGRADQFSWGVVAYELLGGRLPWGSNNDALSLAAAILTAEPPPLASLVPELPVEADEAIHRALSKAPGARFATMGELVAALEAVLGHAGPSPARRALEPLPRAHGAGPSSRPPAPPADLRRYSHDEMSDILDRALKRQQETGRSHDELLAAAREVGIDSRLIEQAAFELRPPAQRAEEHDLERARDRMRLMRSAATFAVVNVFLYFMIGGRLSRFVFLGWGLGVALQAVRYMFPKETDRRQRGSKKRRRREAARERAVEQGVEGLLSATSARAGGVAAEAQPRLRVSPPAAPPRPVGASEPPASSALAARPLTDTDLHDAERAEHDAARRRGARP
jgi:eukaryotic-like serine/threonine-protein kinase